MGLDMYLSVRKHVSGYAFESSAAQSDFRAVLASAGLNESDTKFGNPFAVVEVSVGYWRKANHIHRWFVDEVQGGVDECQSASVSREQLAELAEACDQVAKDSTKANEILPTGSGFFFGGTDYDEYYLEEVKRTSKMLKALLANPTFEDCDFIYQSSW